MNQEVRITPSPALRSLLLECAVNCTVDCCHSQAFDLQGPYIGHWLDWVGEKKLAAVIEELSELQARLQEENNSVKVRLQSQGMESVWPLAEMLEFLVSLRTNLQG